MDASAVDPDLCYLMGPPDPPTEADARAKGMRIALAVAVGFSWAIYSGSIIPFLGPMFAAQFLANGDRPPSLRVGLGMIVIVLATATVLQFLTVLTADRPAVLLLLLGLIYFLCFIAHAGGKGGAAIFLVLVVAVMVPLLTVLNRELASSISLALLQGVVSGVVLTWLAYALIPSRRAVATETPLSASNPNSRRYAFASSVVLLVAVVACLTLDNLSTAIVIPITVATLLLQLEIGASARAGVGLVLANLIGGVVASIAYAALQLRPTPTFLFLIVLFVAMLLGGRAARTGTSAKLFAGALTIFIVVFGLGISPLPGSAAETFSTRIAYISVAIAYTIFMVALLWPPSTTRPQNSEDIVKAD